MNIIKQLYARTIMREFEKSSLAFLATKSAVEVELKKLGLNDIEISVLISESLDMCTKTMELYKEADGNIYVAYRNDLNEKGIEMSDEEMFKIIDEVKDEVI